MSKFMYTYGFVMKLAFPAAFFEHKGKTMSQVNHLQLKIQLISKKAQGTRRNKPVSNTITLLASSHFAVWYNTSVSAT